MKKMILMVVAIVLTINLIGFKKNLEAQDSETPGPGDSDTPASEVGECDSVRKCGSGFRCFDYLWEEANEPAPPPCGYDGGPSCPPRRFSCSDFIQNRDGRKYVGSKPVDESWACRAGNNPCKNGTVQWAGNSYSCFYKSSPPEGIACEEGFDYVPSFEGSDACAPPASFCCYHPTPCGKNGSMVASGPGDVCCVKYVPQELPGDRDRATKVNPSGIRKEDSLKDKGERKGQIKSRVTR